MNEQKKKNMEDIINSLKAIYPKQKEGEEHTKEEIVTLCRIFLIRAHRESKGRLTNEFSTKQAEEFFLTVHDDLRKYVFETYDIDIDLPLKNQHTK